MQDRLFNSPRLDDVRHMPVGEIVRLPAEQLALLQSEAVAALDDARCVKDRLDGAISLRYADQAAMLRRQQDKDAGTVRFEDGDVTVVADLPKKVEWDQPQIAALVQRIRENGEDPADYVEITFRVPERKYAAWPAPIREAFAPARTVKTGKPSFVLRLRDDA